MKLKTSRAARRINHAKQIWNELDYAQRRMFELRTGIPVETRNQRPRIGRSTD